MRLLLSLLLLLTLMACGGSNDDSVDEATATTSSSSSLSSVETHYFGQNGNLWKPAGDEHGGSPGNLVVLFSAQFNNQFDSCQVTLVDGSTAQLICINDQPWTQVPYSCFTNGDRQTWRATFGCSHVAEVKVICHIGTAEYIFTVPDTYLGSVCSRF